MNSPRVISTAPRERLTIFLQKENESIVAFRVHNHGSKTVVCCINSNQKELYAVKPTRFILPDNGSKLVSVRCDVKTVNNLLETDLPTRNKLQVVAYTVNGDVLDTIMQSKGENEKQKIASSWDLIKVCPCEKTTLDVRFTNILWMNPADVPYSVCVSPAGEKEDCCDSCVSHVSFTRKTMVAAIVAMGIAVLIGYIWRHL